MGKVRKIMWGVLLLMGGAGALQANFTTEDLDAFAALTMRMMGTACLDKKPVLREDLERVRKATKDPRLQEGTDPCEALTELQLYFSRAAFLSRTYERDILALKARARRLDPKTFHHACVGLLLPDSREAIEHLKRHYAYEILFACPQTDLPLHCNILMMQFFEKVCAVEGYWEVKRTLEKKMLAVVDAVGCLQQYTPGMQGGRMVEEDIRD